MTVFWFQSLSPVRQPAEMIRFRQPAAMHLLSNSTVSFNGGPCHGSWSCDASESRLSITFHWDGVQERAVAHEFVRVANTQTLVLVRVNGNVRTDAILVPQNAADAGTPDGASHKRLRGM